MFEYIPKYKQAQPDKQYRKNPETFLRNRSWEDELIFKNNNNGQNSNGNNKTEYHPTNDELVRQTASVVSELAEKRRNGTGKIW